MGIARKRRADEARPTQRLQVEPSTSEGRGTLIFRPILQVDTELLPVSLDTALEEQEVPAKGAYYLVLTTEELVALVQTHQRTKQVKFWTLPKVTISEISDSEDSWTYSRVLQELCDLVGVS